MLSASFLNTGTSDPSIAIGSSIIFAFAAGSFPSELVFGLCVTFVVSLLVTFSSMLLVCIFPYAKNRLENTYKPTEIAKEIILERPTLNERLNLS